MEEKRPIFVSDLTKLPQEKDQRNYNLYVNEIYSKDFYLQNRKQYISEASVPILYKAKIPYGYIQTNNTTPLSDSALTLVKRMAIVAEEIFHKIPRKKNFKHTLLKRTFQNEKVFQGGGF